MSNSRINAEKLAKLAGVSLSTVSRALSGKGRVAVSTRKRIQKLAEQYGYEVNPLASNLFAEMRRQASQGFKGTLCWINRSRSRDYWHDRRSPWQRAYLEGVEERARELGFALNSIWLGEPGMNEKRLKEILTSRNVLGLIVPNVDQPQFSIGLPFQNVAHVAIGRLEQDQKCHRVVPDDYGNIRMAISRTRQLGYFRVGGYVSAGADHVANGLISSAFWCDYHTSPPEMAVRPLIDYEGNRNTRIKNFGRWLKEERVDAVVGVLGEFGEWLKALGLNCPDDVGMVHMNLAEDVEGWAGVDPQHRLMGVAAVDVVAARIYRNEFGIPRFPREVLIHGTWSDGWTLPDRT